MANCQLEDTTGVSANKSNTQVEKSNNVNITKLENEKNKMKRLPTFAMCLIYNLILGICLDLCIKAYHHMQSDEVEQVYELMIPTPHRQEMCTILALNAVLLVAINVWSAYCLKRQNYKQMKKICTYLLAIFCLNIACRVIHIIVYRITVSSKIIQTRNYMSTYLDDHQYKLYFDKLQINNKCCGIEDKDDWKMFYWYKSKENSSEVNKEVYPATCCKHRNCDLKQEVYLFYSRNAEVWDKPCGPIIYQAYSTKMTNYYINIAVLAIIYAFLYFCNVFQVERLLKISAFTKSKRHMKKDIFNNSGEILAAKVGIVEGAFNFFTGSVTRDERKGVLDKMLHKEGKAGTKHDDNLL